MGQDRMDNPVIQTKLDTRHRTKTNRVRVRVFNATFNNISVRSWLSA